MVSSMNRISGLASGMDIDDMVKQLMSAARKPLNKLNQDKTRIEWQRDAYRDINTKVLALRNQAFNMRLTSFYSERKAISMDEASFSVSGTASAIEGTYKLRVKELAETAKLTSSKVNAPIGSATTLDQLGLAANTTLTIGGEKGKATISVGKTDSIDSVVRAINGKSNVTGVSVMFDAALDTFFFSSTTTGKSAKIDLTSGDDLLLTNVLHLSSGSETDAAITTGSRSFADSSATKIAPSLTAPQKLKITYGTGPTAATAVFTIDKETTIGSLILQINNSEIGRQGVGAYLDDNKHLAFTNLDPSKAITFFDETSDSTNILAPLGVNNDIEPDEVTFYGFSSAPGKDAVIEYNGVEATYATNTFSINGINITAKKTMASAADIKVTQDTDAIFDKIKMFVEKYNETIDSINKTLEERRYRDFFPLTDEQKKDMKEDDIKRWEEKAKSGLLRNDNMISSALSGIRTALSSIVSGLPAGGLKSLNDIGITTGSYGDKGRLYIDETKLKKAIAEHPSEVAALFTATDGGDKTSNTKDGLATRLVELADGLMDKLKTKAGTASSVDTSYTMGKRMREYDKRIDDLTRRLDALETHYYNQFTAMEKYINQMNVQSMYLQQQFGGA